ncbi:probable aldo-keto reductase 1 isoform X1 [Brachypodium distachyon]|uniref:probable aldo-keto reductase 1 isoform X1 n=1 Tax=Brachypodium distachyon TaxID=15368 RepID=UPI000D0CB10E|nr:probable aldo-keto reductase 1 isoform X1 [Brachypodium distachyon]|eukprot:XP_024315380.1 probable aldo-keto reductase 1 isoform X1 [Brachypodium distachyon]
MEQTPLIPRVRLGTQGLQVNFILLPSSPPIQSSDNSRLLRAESIETNDPTEIDQVSKLGFGCMGLTGAYNTPLDDDAGVAVIAHAFRRGVTFFDTSDVYGPHANEILLGKALKQLPREQVQVATKFGIQRDAAAGKSTVCGRPEYVRACCEASLRRLGLDHIDLYYQHRVDTTIPIEDTIGELKKLVEEGRVKYIGLSEASPDTIRRAHAVHPITAVQMEWSLWARDIEPQIVPLCRELGIGIVPYSPIARGFFGGRGVTQQVSAESSLKGHPRFSAENLEKNKLLYLKMEQLAEKHRCSPAQLALAWVLHQGDDVVPIPGTTKIKNLDSNIDSLKVKLTEDDLKEISSQIREEDVAGGRQYTSFAHTTWNYADTPKK